MTEQKTRLTYELPHTYVLLFVVIILIAALTWIVPSGVFEREELTTEGGSVASTVVPGTFRPIDKVAAGRDLRQGPFDVLSAPAKGIVRAADVIAFVLLLGGVFGIITRTGDKKPANLFTVFAGMDTAAVAKAREYFAPYRPSSPQIGILKDGKLVKMIQRQDIEGRDPGSIAKMLADTFNTVC